MKLRIREFLTAGGTSPFRQWLEGLDLAVRARVQARILRFELGNLGDHRSVGGGVWEARLMFGAGYRIYFGRDGLDVVVLLSGGGKSGQASDIARAKRYWKDYQEAGHGTPE